MTPLDILLTAVAFIALGIAYYAVSQMRNRGDELWFEFQEHERTREQFRLTALEADRNAERVADLEHLIFDIEMWPLLGTGPSPIYCTTWQAVNAA